MLRPLLALTAIATIAAPAAAANYSAKPVTPPASAQIVARDIAWACGPEACTGSTRNSRPLVLCQALAKKAGRIESFTVDGRELPTAELERCNASARDIATAVANAR